MTQVCKWKKSMSPTSVELPPVTVLRRPLGTRPRRSNQQWTCNHHTLVDFRNFKRLFLLLTLVLCGVSSVASVDYDGVDRGYGRFGDSNNNGSPKFDVTDLANLIEMFPEFREYVYQILSDHVTQQQQEQQFNNNNHYVHRAVSASTGKPTMTNNIEEVQNWQINTIKNLMRSNTPTFQSSSTPSSTDLGINSRKDSYLPLHSSYSPIKYGYGYHHSHRDHNDYEYVKKPPSHYNHGWGWSGTEEYKDPKFHYEVGYNLGKDLSCLLGLFKFKWLKDLTFFSFFSILKKIKYTILIALAFKLGVVLSPLALPLLCPLILLAIIAKLLPLLLIIVLLFKLLKAQVKLGGREEGSNTIWEDTHIGRLWESIEKATGNVAKSEKCVEKIICTIKTANASRSLENAEGSDSRGFVSDYFTSASGYVTSILSWLYPFIQWETREVPIVTGGPEEKLIECEKLECIDPITPKDDWNATTIDSLPS